MATTNPTFHPLAFMFPIPLAPTSMMPNRLLFLLLCKSFALSLSLNSILATFVINSSVCLTWQLPSSSVNSSRPSCSHSPHRPLPGRTVSASYAEANPVWRQAWLLLLQKVVVVIGVSSPKRTFHFRRHALLPEGPFPLPPN